MSIIIGADVARFESFGRRPISCTVPLTNLNGGQVESYSVIKHQKRIIGLNPLVPSIKLRQKIYGFFIVWTFNYPDWVSGETLILFDEIIKSAKEGDIIKLTPRIDNDTRQFDVLFHSDSFEIANRTGGVGKIKYNRNAVFQFITSEMITDRKWTIIVPPSLQRFPIGDEGFEQIVLST